MGEVGCDSRDYTESVAMRSRWCPQHSSAGWRCSGVCLAGGNLKDGGAGEEQIDKPAIGRGGDATQSDRIVVFHGDLKVVPRRQSKLLEHRQWEDDLAVLRENRLRGGKSYLGCLA
jgi:hypothetical protein